MEPTQTLGLAHFFAQADGVARALLAILAAMSLATWYLIAVKSLQALAATRRRARFLAAFGDAPSLQAIERSLEDPRHDESFSRLARHAIAVSEHPADFLTRAMRRVIDEETARLESGLTVLASVGSTAPFVGLFGTVWGVYHALVSIAMTGQGTLDKVAGPVGEALIMTALGLAVAIPAVLAYNAFVRRNRIVLAKLDAFAHDLFAFLTTGAHYGEAASAAPRPAVAKAIKGAA